MDRDFLGTPKNALFQPSGRELWRAWGCATLGVLLCRFGAFQVAWQRIHLIAKMIPSAIINVDGQRIHEESAASVEAGWVSSLYMALKEFLHRVRYPERRL